MKLIVLVVFFAVLVSLGSGLFFLVKDQDGERRVMRALTVRISLSVLLFLLLLAAWYAGLIEPHDVVPR